MRVRDSESDDNKSVTIITVLNGGFNIAKVIIGVFPNVTPAI